ncbi:hypothetical protein ACHAWF_001712 [Thalassiosira exigua]
MKVLDAIYFLAIIGISIPSTPLVAGFSAATPSLRSLLAANQNDVASLKDVAIEAAGDDEAVAPKSDVFYLRYILDDSYANGDERVAALKSNLKWRMNEGNAIVTSAHEAISSATADGKWNNAPVRAAAPHADVVNEFLTSAQCITTSLPSTNELVYCIRAGKIDDKGLMSAVSVDQMVEFFLYCKEVNAMVADARSEQADALIKVVTCNDLAGVKLLGGSKEFRKSLSNASKKANDLYPSLNGRTLLLNLPGALGALVKLFTPLFPEAVRKRLRFESGPLKDVEDLREIAEGGNGREEFVEQVTVLAYGD